MQSFEARFSGYARLVEESLPTYLPKTDTLQKSVTEAMAYSLLSGGKRIRAVLALAFFNLYEQDIKPALPFAGAVEMVHAYSLIHDDLPCMDDDDMRRGKPSCHIAYGEAIALLAGDALLTLAFETMAARRYRASFSPEAVLRTVCCLAKASGSDGMIGGQVIDLQHEGQSATPQLLEEMDNKKTGALIQASARIGCLLGGAPEEEQAAAAKYAGHVGLAFQIVDDILDCTAERAQLGKPAGSDREKKKSTYVALYGPERSREMAEQHTDMAKAALGDIPRDTVFLQELADKLLVRNK